MATGPDYSASGECRRALNGALALNLTRSVVELWDSGAAAWLPVSAGPSVRAANVDALPASTRTGDDLEANANGALPAFDGIALAVGDDVVVNPTMAASPNAGVMRVVSLGSGASKWKLTRRFTEAGGLTLPAGSRWFVREGDSLGGHEVYIESAVLVNTTAWPWRAPRGILLRRTSYATGTGAPGAPSPFTHTYHLWYDEVEGEIDASGAGGYFASSAAAQSDAGSGGGSGGHLKIRITGQRGVINATLDVGIGGAGGVGATATAPIAGADSTWLQLATTYRAKGGAIGSRFGGGTAVGTVAGGAPVAGGSAEGGAVLRAESGRNGDPAYRQSAALSFGGKGADGRFGGGGPGGNLGTPGSAGGAGTGHGAGGGGGTSVGATNNNGGAGKDGVIDVAEYS